MAKKLPNEKELLEQLRNEKVVLSSEMWNLIYSNVEDNLSVIRLLITFHLDHENKVPYEEIKKMTELINDVSIVFRKLINPQIIKTEDQGFVKVKDETQSLHPIIKSMFSHYIANDVQSLNFILGANLDDQKDLNDQTCAKILSHIDSMEDFLKMLKTSMETVEERIRNQLTLPLAYMKSLRNSLTPTDQAKLDKCIASLEEIEKLLSQNR